MKRACLVPVVFMIACSGSDSETPDAAPTADAAPVADAAPTVDAAVALFPPPVGYWTMDSADIATDVIADRAGNVDGMISGAVTDAAGQIGEALSFDGADDFIDFGDSLDSVFAGADKAFTISVWASPADSGTARIIAAKNSDGNCEPSEDGRQWILGHSAAGAAQFFFQPLTSGSVQLISGETALASPVAWHHIAIVYDGSIDTAAEDRVTIYVDGTSETLSAIGGGGFPFDLADSPARFALGDRVDSAGNQCTGQATAYAGSIDDVAIFDEALDAAAITAVRDRGLAGAPLVP